MSKRKENKHVKRGCCEPGRVDRACVVECARALACASLCSHTATASAASSDTGTTVIANASNACVATFATSATTLGLRCVSPALRSCASTHAGWHASHRQRSASVAAGFVCFATRRSAQKRSTRCAERRPTRAKWFATAETTSRSLLATCARAQRRRRQTLAVHSADCTCAGQASCNPPPPEKPVRAAAPA
eukprot:3722631-Pleurochrysis_carterae.AAC.1